MAELKNDPEHGLCAKELEDYCEALSSPLTFANSLNELEKETKETMDYSVMLVGALEAKLLTFLVHLTQAKRVLELGCYTGYSALALAEAIPDDGIVFTLDDFSDVPASELLCQKYFSSSPLNHKIKLVKGKAIDSLKTFSSKEPFDLIFMDADKEGQIGYYEYIISNNLLRRPNGLLVHFLNFLLLQWFYFKNNNKVVDNTLWYGKVVLKDQDHTTSVTHAFNKVFFL